MRLKRKSTFEKNRYRAFKISSFEWKLPFNAHLLPWTITFGFIALQRDVGGMERSIYELSGGGQHSDQSLYAKDNIFSSHYLSQANNGILYMLKVAMYPPGMDNCN